jgi:hypothetical protein
VEVGVADREGMVVEPVGEGVAERVVCEGEALEDNKGVSESVDVAEAVGDTEGVAMALGDAEVDAVPVGDAEGVAVAEPVPEGVAVPLPLALPVAVTEKEGVPEGLRLVVSVPEGVRVGEAPEDSDAVGEDVLEGVPEGLRERLLLLEGVLLQEGVPLGVGEACKRRRPNPPPTLSLPRSVSASHASAGRAAAGPAAAASSGAPDAEGEREPEGVLCNRWGNRVSGALCSASLRPRATWVSCAPCSAAARRRNDPAALNESALVMFVTFMHAVEGILCAAARALQDASSALAKDA